MIRSKLWALKSAVICLSSNASGFSDNPYNSSILGLFSNKGLQKLKVKTEIETFGIRAFRFLKTGVAKIASPNPRIFITSIFLIEVLLFSICFPLRIYFS